jgi:hypothetical protein
MLLTLARFIAEIVGLNPAEGMDAHFMFVMCYLNMPLYRLADPLFKGVLLGGCDLETSTLKWARPKVSSCAKENNRKKAGRLNAHTDVSKNKIPV